MFKLASYVIYIVWGKRPINSMGNYWFICGKNTTFKCWKLIAIILKGIEIKNNLPDWIKCIYYIVNGKIMQ